MNILFVAPIIVSNDKFIPHVPLGILSIASVLMEFERNYSIRVVDLNLEIRKNNIVLDKKFYPSIAQFLLSYDPDVIGFTTLCDSYAHVLNISHFIKLCSPKTYIMFGGPQASIVDCQTLDNFDSVDVIVRGEAEKTIIELFEFINGSRSIDNVLGVTYKNKGASIRTNDRKFITDLDELPIPAYQLYPVKELSNQDIPIPIDVGRGCPFSCKFCSTSSFWKNTWRLKSPSRIICEIQYLNEVFDVNNFDLIHDTFTVNKILVSDFCKRLMETNLKIKWKCGSRIDCIDSELLELMARSGCNRLFLGIETGSEEMQKQIGKNLKMKFPEDVLSKLNVMLNIGIMPETSFVFGYPNETEKDLRQTLKMIHEIRRYGIDITQLHMLAPHPGTEFMQKFGESMIYDGYYSDVSSGYNLPENIELIIKYPKIFSAFYYFNLDGLDRKSIVWLDKVIHILYYRLKWTVFVILDILDISFYDLYNNWSESTKYSISQLIVDENHLLNDFKCYLFCMMDSYKLNVSYIIDLIDYELFLYKYGKKLALSKQLDKVTINNEVDIYCKKTLISKRIDVVVKEYEYDLHKIIEDIKRKKLKKWYAPHASYIMFYGENESKVCTLNVDYFVNQVIDLLNGINFTSIVDEMSSLYPGYDKGNIHAACLEIMNKLKINNLVDFAQNDFLVKANKWREIE
jgi:radical SAM superfamily enzyme YgiQ (UPF0313 family)